MRIFILFLSLMLTGDSCHTTIITTISGIDTTYVSGENKEYLNFGVYDNDKLNIWKIERTIEQPISDKAFYLSPNGNDEGDGSINKPWFTLNKAATVIKAGDIILLRGGIYNFSSRQYLHGLNGTVQDTIKIWAYPGEKPVFTKSGIWGSSNHTALIDFDGDYWWFRDIEIKDFIQENQYIWFGLLVRGANHNIFENLSIHDCGCGMRIGYQGYANSDNNLVLNCDFFRNADPLTPTAYDNADGLQIAYISYGSKNTVQGCRMWWNTDDGIDLWSNEGYVAIESTWSFWNGYLPGTYTKAGNGNGFKYGQTQENHGTIILRTTTRCIAFNNSMAGYNNNGANCNMEFFNNLALKNGHSDGWGGGFEFYNVSQPLWIRDNIAYANVPAQIDGPNSTINVNHNSWNTNGYFINIDDTLFLDGARLNGELPKINLAGWK